MVAALWSHCYLIVRCNTGVMRYFELFLGALEIFTGIQSCDTLLRTELRIVRCQDVAQHHYATTTKKVRMFNP
jgi:hypothetical protein